MFLEFVPTAHSLIEMTKDFDAVVVSVEETMDPDNKITCEEPSNVDPDALDIAAGVH
jgi:hypothetical protein